MLADIQNWVTVIQNHLFCRPELNLTGPIDRECIPCAAGTFKPANGSAACQICRNNSDTHEQYPRTPCQCHKGFFDVLTLNMLSSNIRVLRDLPYHLLVASTPAMGSSIAGKKFHKPTFFAEGEYYGNAFVRFSKTTSSTGS